jgi:hypothetical protein
MADTKPARLQDAAPVFVVEDVTRSVEYFRDALGFGTARSMYSFQMWTSSTKS